MEERLLRDCDKIIFDFCRRCRGVANHCYGQLGFRIHPCFYEEYALNIDRQDEIHVRFIPKVFFLVIFKTIMVCFSTNNFFIMVRHRDKCDTLLHISLF